MLILLKWWYLVFPDGSSQHSPRLSSSWPVSAHDRSAWLSTWFLHGTSSLRCRLLTLRALHSQKIICLTEEWWEMRLRVDNFGAHIPTFMSFFYFWLHKCFQIIVQYCEWTKPAIIVEIAWVSSVWCSSGSHINVLNLLDVWQRKQAGHSQFLCIKIFFRWFFRHFQFCIAIPVSQFCVCGPAGFVHIPTLSFLYEWTSHFQSVLFSETHSVFTPAEVTGWGISFSCLGCWFLNSIFMSMERNIMLVPHSSSSFQLMPLNCSTTKVWR